jgi:hypothetical protein
MTVLNALLHIMWVYPYRQKYKFQFYYSECSDSRYTTFYTSNVHGSVHRNNILIYTQQDATLHSLFYLKTVLHVSGGTSTHHQKRKQLSTASGIYHTVTATV